MTTQPTPGPRQHAEDLAEYAHRIRFACSGIGAENATTAVLKIANAMDERAVVLAHEGAADARLIAAAPRMLAVLKRLCAMMQPGVEPVAGSGLLNDLIYGTEGVEVYAEARALLRDIHGDPS